MLIFQNFWTVAATLLAAFLVSACSHSPTRTVTNAPETVFTVQAEGQRAVLRVVTRAPACPDIAWDGQAPQRMLQRAAPATPRVRQDSGQADNKAAVFDVLTCEATWAQGAAFADVAGHRITAPKSEISRIVIVADTGCRLKASENAFQDCNDAAKWPFAQVAQSAAALKPDLVIHIGDCTIAKAPAPQATQAAPRPHGVTVLMLGRPTFSSQPVLCWQPHRGFLFEATMSPAFVPVRVGSGFLMHKPGAKRVLAMTPKMTPMPTTPNPMRFPFRKTPSLSFLIPPKPVARHSPKLTPLMESTWRS